MKLKDAINELGLAPNEDIFVHIYGKNEDDIIYKVQDVDSKLLKRIVKVVHKNYGGIEYNYRCYRFILE